MPPGPCFPNSGTERLVDGDMIMMMMIVMMMT